MRIDLTRPFSRPAPAGFPETPTKARKRMNKLQGAVLPTMIGMAAGIALVCTMAACLPDAQPSPEPSPAASATQPVAPIQEDSPEWDCRTMGNHLCGVEIHGDWYLVAFDATTGAPTGVTRR